MCVAKDDTTNLKKDFQVSNIQNQGIMHETETRKNGLLVEIRSFRLIISCLGVILNIHPVRSEYPGVISVAQWPLAWPGP